MAKSGRAVIPSPGSVLHEGATLCEASFYFPRQGQSHFSNTFQGGTRRPAAPGPWTEHSFYGALLSPGARKATELDAAQVIQAAAPWVSALAGKAARGMDVGFLKEMPSEWGMLGGSPEGAGTPECEPPSTQT